MPTMLAALFSEGGQSLWEKIATWYQSSMLKELIDYFSQRYFTVEFDTYENFSVGSNAAIVARNAILAMAVGIIIAAIMTAYTREKLGGFVRALLKTESLSPEHAKTLMELGYFRNASIRGELAGGTSLRMVVRCREEEEWRAKQEAASDAAKNASQKEPPYRIDFTTAHFYIPEDLRHRADIRFDRKGSGWLPVIATIVVAIIAAAALCWFLPDILRLADNIITVFSPS